MKLRKLISLFLIFSLLFQQTGLAQAQVLPSSILPVGESFNLPVLKGIKFYPDNPLKLDFIIEQGSNSLPLAGRAREGEEAQPAQGAVSEAEAKKLIKYFLAALAIPEQDLWVNLSPNEPDRVIPNELGSTDMGGDLLSQDYILKQITASLTKPEESIGKEYWQKIYSKAQELFGTTKIPVNTYNRVWILPDKAVVYEDKDKAIVGEAKLKVMLEEDYLAQQVETVSTLAKTSSRQETVSTLQSKQINTFSSNITKQTILPIIEKEVNSGKNFANLRQVYSSLILALWFKKKLKTAINQNPPVPPFFKGGIKGGFNPLTQLYIDQKKTKGIEGADPNIKEKVYQQYLESFQKGLYNYIKTDKELGLKTEQSRKRKYFSGGFTAFGATEKLEELPYKQVTPAVFSSPIFEGKVELKQYSDVSYILSEGEVTKVKIPSGKKNAGENSYNDESFPWYIKELTSVFSPSKILDSAKKALSDRDGEDLAINRIQLIQMCIELKAMLRGNRYNFTEERLSDSDISKTIKEAEDLLKIIERELAFSLERSVNLWLGNTGDKQKSLFNFGFKRLWWQPKGISILKLLNNLILNEKIDKSILDQIDVLWNREKVFLPESLVKIALINPELAKQVILYMVKLLSQPVKLKIIFYVEKKISQSILEERIYFSIAKVLVSIAQEKPEFRKEILIILGLAIGDMRFHLNEENNTGSIIKSAFAVCHGFLIKERLDLRQSNQKLNEIRNRIIESGDPALISEYNILIKMILDIEYSVNCYVKDISSQSLSEVALKKKLGDFKIIERINDLVFKVKEKYGNDSSILSKSPQDIVGYYRELGLKNGSPPEEVRRVFRELAMKFHPDKNPENESAEEKFKKINEANEQLVKYWEGKTKDQSGNVSTASSPVVKRKGSIDGLVSSPLITNKKTGGIDLTPKNLELKVKGEGMNLPVSSSLSLDPATFQGFSFQILSIQPVKNLQSLLLASAE